MASHVIIILSSHHISILICKLMHQYIITMINGCCFRRDLFFNFFWIEKHISCKKMYLIISKKDISTSFRFSLAKYHSAYETLIYFEWNQLSITHVKQYVFVCDFLRFIMIQRLKRTKCMQYIRKKTRNMRVQIFSFQIAWNMRVPMWRISLVYCRK